MSLPLVSCLCVTKNKLPHLTLAIDCFKAQIYRNRELIIIYESDNLALKKYIKTHRSVASIRFYEVPVTPKLTLGELRNLSIEKSKGQYVCQWDDDDWHHPRRISEQLSAVLDNKKQASILLYWIIFDVKKRQAYLSFPWYWPGTLLFDKRLFSKGFEYPSLGKGEDAPLVQTLITHKRLYPIVNPSLYVYSFHGSNTWSDDHFKMLLSRCQPLSKKESLKIWGLFNKKTDYKDFNNENEFDYFHNWMAKEMPKS